jgi:hypothetical protein
MNVDVISAALNKTLVVYSLYDACIVGGGGLEDYCIVITNDETTTEIPMSDKTICSNQNAILYSSEDAMIEMLVEILIYTSTIPIDICIGSKPTWCDYQWMFLYSDCRGEKLQYRSDNGESWVWYFITSVDIVLVLGAIMAYNFIL